MLDMSSRRYVELSIVEIILSRKLGEAPGSWQQAQGQDAVELTGGVVVNAFIKPAVSHTLFSRRIHNRAHAHACVAVVCKTTYESRAAVKTESLSGSPLSVSPLLY
jgi:hypothetical protein